MSFTISVEVKINKSFQQVREFIFEPINEPYWISGVQETHMLSVRPIGRGTQVQRIGKFLGRPVMYNLEMTEYDPEGNMTWLSMNAPFAMEVNYKLSETGDNVTLFRQTFKAKTKGINKLLLFFLKGAVIKNIRSDMSHIKSLLEKE